MPGAKPSVVVGGPPVVARKILVGTALAATGAVAAQRSRVHARTIGDGSVGVVLLHGLGGSGAYWGAAYDSLAGTGRLVVPDLLGFGASPRPRSGYTADDHVAELVALLDELGVAGPVVVGAHSMGCLIALALARRHPELVAGIVAFCPPLYPDEATARDRIARLGWLERQLATDGRWAETSCRLVCDHRRAAATVAALLRPGLPGVIRRDGVQHTWASYSQTFGHVLATADGGRWLAELQVPVELVAGTDDGVTDLAYLHRLAAELAHVTLTVRVGADHDLPLTDPAGAVATLAGAARLLASASAHQLEALPRSLDGP